MSDVEYRGFGIEPKWDWGDGTMRGFVVVRDGCNPMPGAIWFENVREAQEGIDIFIQAQGDARVFWVIYRYRTAQRDEARLLRQSDVLSGRVSELLAAIKASNDAAFQSASGDERQKLARKGLFTLNELDEVWGNLQSVLAQLVEAQERKEYFGERLEEFKVLKGVQADG